MFKYILKRTKSKPTQTVCKQTQTVCKPTPAVHVDVLDVPYETNVSLVQCKALIELFACDCCRSLIDWDEYDITPICDHLRIESPDHHVEIEKDILFKILELYEEHAYYACSVIVHACKQGAPVSDTFKMIYKELQKHVVV